MKRRVDPVILAIVLFGTACATAEPGASPSTTAAITTIVPSTTTHPTSTTVAPTTTVAAAPGDVDLSNPIEGTLAGVPIGSGPVDPMIAAL